MQPRPSVSLKSLSIFSGGTECQLYLSRAQMSDIYFIISHFCSTLWTLGLILLKTGYDGHCLNVILDENKFSELELRHVRIQFNTAMGY